MDNAARYGAVGVIVCPDPAHVAPHGGKNVYPDHEWLPGNAVPRGTAHKTAGDLLTPGYPSQSRNCFMFMFLLGTRIIGSPFPTQTDKTIQV